MIHVEERQLDQAASFPGGSQASCQREEGAAHVLEPGGRIHVQEVAGVEQAVRANTNRLGTVRLRRRHDPAVVVRVRLTRRSAVDLRVAVASEVRMESTLVTGYHDPLVRAEE